jgi:hypothetical protein
VVEVSRNVAVLLGRAAPFAVAAVLVVFGFYTRHTWISHPDARLSRPIAALPLLAIEPAIPRRRTLRSDPIDAPHLPKNPCATGIQARGAGEGKQDAVDKARLEATQQNGEEIRHLKDQILADASKITKLQSDSVVSSTLSLSPNARLPFSRRSGPRPRPAPTVRRRSVSAPLTKTSSPPRSRTPISL